MTPLRPDNPASDTPLPDAPAGKKSKKEKKKKASKGVETLFRTTLSNHMKLSEMADRKANLMISINTIIISITISAYARTVDVPANFLLPSMLLLTVCLVTIVVSLIATNPTITSGPKRVKPEGQPIDLLFFGSYMSLTADEYRDQLRVLLSNDETLYASLIDNMYAQGRVLARKYRLLKFAYQFFMLGFSTVVLTVMITMLVNH